MSAPPSNILLIITYLGKTTLWSLAWVAAVLMRHHLRVKILTCKSWARVKIRSLTMIHFYSCDQLVMLSAISKPIEVFRKMSPLTKKIQNWFFRHDSFSNILVFLLQRYASIVPMLLPISEEKKYLKTVAGAHERLVELLKAGTCFTSRRIDGWHNDVALFDSLDNVPMNDITVPTLVLHGRRPLYYRNTSMNAKIIHGCRHRGQKCDGRQRLS